MRALKSKIMKHFWRFYPSYFVLRKSNSLITPLGNSKKQTLETFFCPGAVNKYYVFIMRGEKKDVKDKRVLTKERPYQGTMAHCSPRGLVYGFMGALVKS